MIMNTAIEQVLAQMPKTIDGVPVYRGMPVLWYHDWLKKWEEGVITDLVIRIHCRASMADMEVAIHNGRTSVRASNSGVYSIRVKPY